MLDVTDFVNRNFDPVTPAKDGDELRVNCPYCIDDKQHMYISTILQTCHCFKCGTSASWVSLAMSVLQCTYWVALGELYHKPRMVDFTAVFNGKQVTMLKAVTLPDGFANILNADTPTARLAYRYVIRRSFTDRHISYYNLGVSPSVSYRLIIPIEGEYWQGRRLYEWMEPKYLNPANPAKDAIFNSQALDLYEEVVVCEGAFSAMAVGENAVALIGKECPNEKADRLMAASVKRYILTVEPEAIPEMSKLANKLYKAGKEVELWYYNGDPAEYEGNIKKVEWSFKTQVMNLLGG